MSCFPTKDVCAFWKELVNFVKLAPLNRENGLLKGCGLLEQAIALLDHSPSLLVLL